MRKFLTLLFALTICFCPPVLARNKNKSNHKPKSQVNQAQRDANFRQLFAAVFAAFDGNHDGKLDLKELNLGIISPQIQGTESAIAVFLHRHLLKDDDDTTNGLSLAEVMQLADDPAVQKNVTEKARHIHSINRSLFLYGDPNLLTFHQGGIGDCYLLATIGAFVYQHPQTVRSMISQQADGSFFIQFGDGKKLSVPPVTDAELIMGAREGENHGIWLAVLEKAYAQIDLGKKEEKTGQGIYPGDTVDTDFIGHGGTCGPAMTLLTGHKTAGAPMARWLKQDPQDGLDKIHKLLAKLSYDHKLMTITTGKKKPLPKGIAHGHCYGVLAYNPVGKIVTVFNPWGNHFKPAGAPGIENGYPTEHGIFQMPLADFANVFGGFAYETDKPARAAK